MELKKGDLVVFRLPFEEFPRRGKVITIGKRRGTALVGTTGIQERGGERKLIEIVERVPLDHIFHKVVFSKH